MNVPAKIPRMTNKKISANIIFKKFNCFCCLKEVEKFLFKFHKMKKSVGFLLIFLFVFLIFSFSFVSAGWFSDFLKKFLGSSYPREGCTDSDGGRYMYMERGVVNFEGNVYNDTCYGPTLQEFYCGNDGRVNSDEINCLIELDLAGCSDGACVNKTCNDSDGGLNWHEKGIADGRFNGIGAYYEDVCLLKNKTGVNSWEYVEVFECSGENCTLQEGFCNGTEVSNIAHECNWSSGEVCREGACVFEESCTDSDGGNQPFVYGFAEGIDREGLYYNAPDRCLTGCCNFLREQTCNGTRRASVYINCSEFGENNTCIDGACVHQ